MISDDDTQLNSKYFDLIYTYILAIIYTDYIGIVFYIYKGNEEQFVSKENEKRINGQN